MARPISRNTPVPFSRKLVLNQWVLGQLGVQSFEDLQRALASQALEGLDGNNVHHFHHALTGELFNLTNIPTETLLEYDQNIVKHTQRLNERRLASGEEPITWKYFQYLALLCTEIYLDNCFRDPEGLLAQLNEQIAIYNDDKAKRDRVEAFDSDAEAWRQLNKISFWMATGSGKTLLMHVNLLQFLHYLEKHGRQKELNRILLLTPNEGLSLQHLREFQKAGLEAALFNKEGGGLLRGRSIEILDVHKLKDEMGDKTVAVEAFEGNNLVLVDEGHSGARAGSGGVWMRYRNALCEKGFSFEYSATFGQAIGNNKDLTNLYAKNILFDYSYRWFYNDGFGKDFHILNLDQSIEQNHLKLYLTACLLTYYQQLRLFEDQGKSLRPFRIEKPLWIFVGGSVTATLANRDASDIVRILRFLSEFVSDRPESIRRIQRVLEKGLVTADGSNLFAGHFPYLSQLGMDAAAVFDDILRRVFHAPGGGRLYVENLKGAQGEVALKVGMGNEPFGLINVGDAGKLVKICETEGFDTGEKEFAGSLFHSINQRDSSLHLLVGSKKFTEGWSSWRVATMGLMNVGKGEGAQIIQLFGRGVRLQGYDSSLKRSSKARLPEGLQPPEHLHLLETLGIFGIQADYMAQFRELLEEEGLSTSKESVEIFLPVIKNLGKQKLKTIRLKKTIGGISTEFGDAFRKLGPIPTLKKPSDDEEGSDRYFLSNQVVLNWYPKIQALRSRKTDPDSQVAPHQAHLSEKHLAFIDWDALYFDLERFKAERGWYNLNLTREGIMEVLSDTSWYQLLIPAEELAFDSFGKVRIWQEIAGTLLKKYTERYYTFRKRAWEMPHLEYRELDESDPNFLGTRDAPDEGYYRIIVDKSQDEIIQSLLQLKAIIEKGDIQSWEFQGLQALWFSQHLYQPLLYANNNLVEISPVALNEGEKRFVEDLRGFYKQRADFFKTKQLYFLRNLSRGRGVGFFEAANFHPDFILWLLDGDRQHIVFVDPKGLRNLGITDPKVQFYETIKEIEKRLGDPLVSLDSFLVSRTSFAQMKLLWSTEADSMTKENLEQRHILFQDDQDYIEKLFRRLGFLP